MTSRSGKSWRLLCCESKGSADYYGADLQLSADYFTWSAGMLLTLLMLLGRASLEFFHGASAFR